MKSIHEMSDKELRKFIDELQARYANDSAYCLDDPGGYLTREADKLGQEITELQSTLLRRENTRLKKRLKRPHRPTGRSQET
jgi:hypothetical protein